MQEASISIANFDLSPAQKFANQRKRARNQKQHKHSGRRNKSLQKNPCKKSCCSRRDHLEKSAKRQKLSDQIAYDQSIYEDDFEYPEIMKKVEKIEKHDLPQSVIYRPQRYANEIASLTISNFNKEEFEALYLKT